MDETLRPLPWDGLPKPDASAQFSSMRVDPFFQWDVYWTLDYRGRPGFLIQLDQQVELPRKLPRLAELKVDFTPDNLGKYVLVVVLEQPMLKRVLFDFCQGLVREIARAENQEGVAALAVNYLWNWVRFLKGYRQELTPEKQRGLIGELVFLNDQLAPRIGWRAAVTSWSGPMGTPKDFSWQETAVEVKTHLISAEPSIKMSNEFQLDVADFDNVWLFIVGFQNGDESTPECFSVTEEVDAVREAVSELAPDMLEAFETRILEYGYHPGHDYSDVKWLVGSRQVFQVRDGFPAITSGTLPQGITNVKYQISLASIAPFEADLGAIFEKEVTE